MGDNKNVVIIGSGIVGITTALDLAQTDSNILLIESSPFIGGKLSQLDRQFPNDACGMCQVYPFINNESSQYCLRRVFEHPNIKVITQSEVLKISNDGPRWKISLQQSKRGVEVEKCIGCQKCEDVCPVEVDSVFNAPLGKRKAIYQSYPLPYPNAYVIDWGNCTKCGECVKVCPTDCIQLDDGKPQIKEIEADTIVITSGFQEMNVEPLKNYGYGRWKNVVTGLELERIISEFGPLKGELKRPSDGKIPEKIAFLHCIGSRSKENPDCSSVCCMYTLKEMHLIKKLYPSINLTSFYMDMRAYGKGYYRYFKKTDARFIPQRPGGVEADEEGNLIIKYEDASGKMIREKFDMVVLAAGQTPNIKIEGIETHNGYISSNPFEPVKIKDGIYAAGSAIAPKDITDSIIDAHAAASYILSEVSEKEGKKAEPLEEEFPPKMGLCLCKCGGIVSDKIDFERLSSIRNDVEFIEIEYLCKDGITQLKEWVKEKGITRLTIGACPPFIIENLIKAHLGNVIYDIVDLREGIGLNNNDKQDTAEFLISSSLTKLENYFNESLESFPIAPSTVIVGGGIAGMNAALKIAESGINSILIEKTNILGGNARNIKNLISGEGMDEYLKDLISRVEANEDIKILRETNVLSIDGVAGNFQIDISDKDGKKDTLNAGAVIIATGANSYKPVEYLYGKNDRVITQLELEKLLVEGGGLTANSQLPTAVVMIQCVGSRNDEHPWCSRVCCSDAIKNALKIKETSPDTDIFILYRDIMMYGSLERYYTEARNKGIIFIRFNEGEEPKVKETNEGLEIIVKDSILKTSLKLNPDILVLSTGVVPQNLSFLPEKIEYTEDGFLKEANQKFKPLETNIPGIFLAGLVHSPRNVPEAIAQAEGAAGMAVSLIKSRFGNPNKQVSIVHERKCVGCGLCVDVCPYGARYIDEETKKAKVYPYICQGCGDCATACPSGATEMVFATKGMIESIDKI